MTETRVNKIPLETWPEVLLKRKIRAAMRDAWDEGWHARDDNYHAPNPYAEGPTA